MSTYGGSSRNNDLYYSERSSKTNVDQALGYIDRNSVKSEKPEITIRRFNEQIINDREL